MRILGIESTCDETSCSIVEDGRNILSNVISSQIDLHAAFGGVVPELSCRRHVEVILPIIQEALAEAQMTLDQVDAIAVAHGPGLIGALIIGLTAAKSLSLATNIPFIGVNHIEAHLYAALMSHPDPVAFPCLGVVLSGGHTSLVRVDDIGNYKLLGETHDDAIGEAFDKVGKLLNLPYPGGPYIEKLAKSGNPFRFPFKAGRIKEKPFDFSFSGLKTAVLYAIRGQNSHVPTPIVLTDQDKADIAASFQHAAFDDVIEKTIHAARAHGCTTVLFGGGVTNSQTLRHCFTQKAAGLQLLWPTAGLSLDNAAMIAGLGYHMLKRNGASSLDLEPATRIPFATSEAS
jgi:N6-L-threonylcarbamoyladenine synthase